MIQPAQYKENTITIKKPIVFPIGLYIKISNARYNNGIFEVISEETDGYELNKKLMPGEENAIITPLNIPKGLLEVISYIRFRSKELLEKQVHELAFPKSVS